MAAGSSPSAHPTSGRNPHFGPNPSNGALGRAPTRTYARAETSMPALAAHFIGRRPELSVLEAALDELDGRRGQAIEIVGAAGLGKTRLLAELAARADTRGHIVLGGAGADLERDLPFWVFVDALDEYLAGVEPRRLANLEEDVRVELAQVFPSLSDLARGGSPGALHERYRTNRAIRELLERLAATKPLVLLFDDFHWADPASVDLAASLLHRPPAAGVLLVLASRPNHAFSRLRSATGHALRAGELTRIELDPLTNEEAAAMLGRGSSDAEAALLYEESGGNPFYLEQLARASGGAGRTAAEAEVSVSGLRVPAMVVAALDEELTLLSAGSRRLLQGASVAGGRHVDQVERPQRHDGGEREGDRELTAQPRQGDREELADPARAVHPRGLVERDRDLLDAGQEEHEAEAEHDPAPDQAEGRQREVEVAEPAAGQAAEPDRAQRLVE